MEYEAVTKLLAGSAASMARCGWGEGSDSSKGCSGAGDAVSGDLGELISEDHFCRVIDASPLALLVRKKQEIKILSLDLWQ